MKILVLNAGSSSQKACLYEISEEIPHQPPVPLWSANVDWSHHAGMAEIKVKTHHQQSCYLEISGTSRQDAFIPLLNTLTQGSTKVIENLDQINAVGHRVVHGGQEYRHSVVINEAVKKAIANLFTLAPAHNPVNLEGIVLSENFLGDIPQVAVFDTAFHATIPDAAAIYPIPYNWVEKGMRRYGFHGISHQYCAQRAAQILHRDPSSLRLVNCHLGNGASLAAILHGRCIDTTMGFTPLDGLMMGSRCGSIDPGILIQVLRQEKLSVDELERKLNQESGLKGISGISSDMRAVQEASEKGNDSRKPGFAHRAQLAIDIYTHTLRKHIGAMVASLGGVDALIFTAGVGENSPLIRQAVCSGLNYLGLKLDEDKNQQNPIDVDIATEDSHVRVVVIHTQEDWQIARETWQVLKF